MVHGLCFLYLRNIKGFARNHKCVNRIYRELELDPRVKPRTQASGDYAAEFDVIGSRDGWFLIRNARFADYGNDKGDQVFLRGPGWVFADKVRFLINGLYLRATASPSSRVVIKLASADGSSGPDSAIIDHVYACAGDVAEVSAHMAGRPSARGWASRICSNQVTTCP